MKITEVVAHLTEVELIEYQEHQQFLNENYSFTEAYSDNDFATEVSNVMTSLDKKGQTPKVGQDYFVDSVTLFPGPEKNTKFMKITSYANKFKVIDVATVPYKHLKLENNTGEIVNFPSRAGDILEKTSGTLLFNSTSEQEQTFLAIKLKFSNSWNIIQTRK